nr:MAG TPA: DNA-binding transcriptional regulator [Caudoviricetes sp.]
MEINMGAFNTLLREKFNNNQSEMAKVLNISRYQLNMIINHNGKNAGKKIIGAIIKYCDSNNYNFRDYIFLT